MMMIPTLMTMKRIKKTSTGNTVLMAKVIMDSTVQVMEIHNANMLIQKHLSPVQNSSLYRTMLV